MSTQEDPYSDKSFSPYSGREDLAEFPLFSIPVPALLAYIEWKTGVAFTPFGGTSPFGHGTLPSLDWHRLVREGFGRTLHLNLGIPGIEEPPHPLEENAAALQAAVLLGHPSIEVILSGELDLAVEAGLIPEKALSNLRNQIRVSG